MLVIIDCGHGGVINGVYQDLASLRTPPDYKSYVFKEDGLTVYEGVINRIIGSKLITLLDKDRIPYVDLNSKDQSDQPLGERVKRINDIALSKNGKCWLLSIHSNKMTSAPSGFSLSGRGCESYISISANKISEMIQLIAEEQYKKDGHRWRGSKRADFFILRHSRCPSLLVENYFYTNRQDAEFLLSDTGQNKIASTLYSIVKTVSSRIC